MSDLVRRSALLEAYDKAHVGPPGGARKLIEEAPAVDAVPVVHGRWIPTYHKYYNRDGECLIADEWHCSECGAFQRDTRNYCPNCGARMDGEADV